MEISDYSAVAKLVDGYPNSLVDRASSVYPSKAFLPTVITQQMEEKVALAGLEVSAMWANTLKKVIKIETKTKFVYSNDNGDYGIALVLVEDGMSGKTSNWAQVNNLSGNKDYATSNPFWYSSGSSVSGVKFNHVAVAAWNIADGAKNSVNPVIQAGEEQTYTYNANVSNNTLIQDKTKLKVVAMLIDRSTGLIENAAQAAVEDYDPTGIESIQNSQFIIHDEGDVYDLSGRKVNSQPKQKGIYIINGRKVVKP